jgi:hypothetical protein
MQFEAERIALIRHGHCSRCRKESRAATSVSGGIA